MPRERALRWEPVPDVRSSCADISLFYAGADQLSVTMHFSPVVGQPACDLRLEFAGAISMRWEDESFGLNPLPEPLPQIGSGAQPTWTFPLLRIEHSSWLAAHGARNPLGAARREHFALVALNDLVQILALPDVEAAWIDAPQNT